MSTRVFGVTGGLPMPGADWVMGGVSTGIASPCCWACATANTASFMLTVLHLLQNSLICFLMSVSAVRLSRVMATASSELSKRSV